MIAILILQAVCFAVPLNALEKKRVTLAEALNIALDHNGAYREALARERVASEKVNAVWGQLLPAMESELSALGQGADSGFQAMSDGAYDFRVIQMRFAINPGYFHNSLKSSYEELAVARQDVRRARYDVEYGVIKSYFDVVLAREMLGLKKESRLVFEENLRIVENLYKTGSVPLFEVLQAKVRLGGIGPEILDAETELATAEDSFCFALGGDAGAFDAAGEEGSAGSIGMINNAPEGDIVALALKNRPELISMDHVRKKLRYGQDVLASSYLWPTFSLTGSWGLNYPLANSTQVMTPMGAMDLSSVSGRREWQDTWQVRLAATYRWSSLLPCDTGRAQEREIDERLAEADERFEEMRRQTVITIRSHLGRIKSSTESIAARRQTIETAEEGLRMARESYRAGVIRNSELLDAELSLTTARTVYIKALYDYHVSLAALGRDGGEEARRLVVMEESSENK